MNKELYKAFPQNVDFKDGLAVSYSQLGRFFRDQKNDTEKARSFFKQCHELWKELANDFPAFVEYQNNLKWVQKALADLDK
ncbi:MAG: tetratricopeptide repeat protein [Saprospiraceae bacterium]